MDTQVDAGSIIKQMEAYINHDGFYMVKDGQTILVKQLQKKVGEVFKDFPDQDIVFQSINEDRNVSYVPFPAAEVILEEGQEVYYGGFSTKQNKVDCQSGRIDKIDEDNSSFTVQGPTLSNYPAGPVFVYDKIRNVAVLAGIISPKEPQAYSIAFFDSEERGGLIVQFGEYKGFELRTPGRGPRSISITGPMSQKLTYRLNYLDGKKTLNPHSDTDYLKNQPLLYQTALQEFAKIHNGGKGALPAQFNFSCYKGSDYLAQQ